jgi:hypothetical protein
VPQKYPENRKLGVWVNKQRMEKKAFEEEKVSKMTERKIERLEAVGFNWYVQTHDVSGLLRQSIVAYTMRLVCLVETQGETQRRSELGNEASRAK